MRVFLDANILFSAAKSSGAVRQFLRELKIGGHTLVADAYVADEARRNLEAKFPDAPGELGDLLRSVEVSFKVAPPLDAALAPELPEKDRPVLAAAIRLSCQILLTGDKTHFGPLYGRKIEGVEFHSPASLAGKIAES